MATFEDLKLILQTHRNLENLRRDMRGNAQSYLTAVAAGKPLAGIATTIRGNTTEYLRRLAWALTAWNDLPTRAKIQSGLAAWSLQQSELTGAYTELKTAADAEDLAPVSTAVQIQALANATLAAVPAHTSIWPE